MENIRNRINFQLVTEEDQYKKLVKKPNFKHRTIFNENFMGVHMLNEEIKYNKPIYLGSSILDIYKNLMYDFHYNYIKVKYGDKATLLFTDTDSLCCHIETEDFLEDIKDDIQHKFDTSNFPKEGYDEISGKNKSAIGFMKLVNGSKTITEFVGLRAKLYAYKTQECEEDEKKCKGIKKNIIKKDITFDDYKNTLFSNTPQLRKMYTLKSCLHNIYLQEINKLAMASNDDKRVILKDGISTLALEHYKTRST